MCFLAGTVLLVERKHRLEYRLLPFLVVLVGLVGRLSIWTGC